VPPTPPLNATAPYEPPPLPAHAAAAGGPPLRFVWQTDVDGHFAIDSEEFIALVGPRTTSVLSKPWSEIAATLALDPDGQVARAFASRNTWSGITVGFPVDGTDARLAVELSKLRSLTATAAFAATAASASAATPRASPRLMETRRVGSPGGPRVEPPVFGMNRRRFRWCRHR
jgi:hypothetical protein